MCTVIFFRAIRGEGLFSGQDYYADRLGSETFAHRPMVGDMYLVTDPLGTYGVAIEHLVYVAHGLFHAYCRRVEPSWEYPPYYGIRGNPETLIAHSIDHVRDLPSQYDQTLYHPSNETTGTEQRSQ